MRVTRVRLLTAGLLFGVSGVPASQNQEPRCTLLLQPSDSGSGRFGSIAPGPGGRLAWTDGRPGQFLLRDANGKVRVVGRDGAGPGEFRYIGSMNWVGDTLWVSDFRLPRVQFFNDTGKLIRVSTAILPATWGAAEGARLVGFANQAVASDLPWVVLSHRIGSTSLDTIGSFPMVPAARFPLPPTMTPNKQPLLPETVVGFSPNFRRFCGAMPVEDRLRVQCVDNQGNVILNHTLSLSPRALTDSIYASAVSAFVRLPERSESAVREMIRRPRALPLALSLMVDNEGVIWLGRSHRSEKTLRWVRLGQQGSVKDSVALQGQFRIMRVAGDTAWATAADQDGLQSLYRCVMR
jgi:hypothetical protein